MRVLIISMSPRWKEPPRLVRALSEAGASVASLAVSGSLIDCSRFLKQRYALHGDAQQRLGDLNDAVNTFKPDVLLPGDELSVRWLQTLYKGESLPAPLQALIVKSLGAAQWYGHTTDKLAMSKLAEDLGIPQPETADLARDEDAHEFVHRQRWPVVIKARQGFAGFEVFPCANLRELRYALRECSPGAPRLIQSFIGGVTWMVSFVARAGELLGALVAEKQCQYPPLIGPSTILRFSHDPGLIAHARALVQHLGFSGFGSIDFLLPQNGPALFIEFNPRPTPICHLGSRLDVDLAKAFVAGQALDSSAVLEGQRIALFPQEIQRDPSGASLVGCWHDIPDDEPELVAAMQAQ